MKHKPWPPPKSAIERNKELRDILNVLAVLLESPQNRFGKLEFYSEEARAARIRIQEMAVAYGVAPSNTICEQAAKVARAVLANAHA